MMNREHLESMRWLYDSDESYKKAMRQIMAEEVKEKRRAMLKKKVREARFKKRVHTTTQPLRTLVGKVRIPRKVARARGLAAKTIATHRRVSIAGAAVLGVLVVGVFGYGIYASKHKAAQPGQGGGSGVAGASTAAEAPFDPVILSDKASKPADYRYDGEKKLLTYSATIAGVGATISQQPFPEDFIKDTEKFEAFLDSIPQRQTVELSDGTAYLSVLKSEGDSDAVDIIKGMTGDQEVQYAVYMNAKFLVFVRTEKPLPKQQWQDYFKYLTLN